MFSSPKTEELKRQRGLMLNAVDKGFTGGFRTQTLGFVPQLQCFIHITGFHRFLNRIVKVGF